jgi:predicted DNA binding protein
MLHAQFRIKLPKNTWIACVSEQYPCATFRLLSGIQTGEAAVELGEVVTDSPREIFQEIGVQDAISQAVELACTESKVLLKYESTDTGLYSFAGELALPLQFPIVVQDGWYIFELTGTRGEFDTVRDRLEEVDCRFELLSVVGGRRESNLLTDRQREVLTAAVQQGYFSVPRSCTLSDLADQLGADESTLSGILRRGQERILTSYLGGQ